MLRGYGEKTSEPRAMARVPRDRGTVTKTVREIQRVTLGDQTHAARYRTNMRMPCGLTSLSLVDSRARASS
jgi:hypothetical protein